MSALDYDLISETEPVIIEVAILPGDKVLADLVNNDNVLKPSKSDVTALFRWELKIKPGDRVSTESGLLVELKRLFAAKPFFLFRFGALLQSGGAGAGTTAAELVVKQAPKEGEPPKTLPNRAGETKHKISMNTPATNTKEARVINLHLPK